MTASKLWGAASTLTATLAAPDLARKAGNEHSSAPPSCREWHVETMGRRGAGRGKSLTD